MPMSRTKAKCLKACDGSPLDELLRDASIEFVAVESRVQRNLQYARRCIAAGKHIHLDKAPGEDLEGLRSLLKKQPA